MVGFARDKLLSSSWNTGSVLSKDQQLACLAVRLGLEFQVPAWLEQESERVQVERHMRLCLDVSASTNRLTTISPSEPLLAEAALAPMRRMNSQEALLSHIDTSYLDAGNRGELVSSLFLLQARDNALSVPAQPVRFTELQPDSDVEPERFTDTQPDSDVQSERRFTDSPPNTDSLKTDGGTRVVKVSTFLTELLSVNEEELLAHLPREFRNEKEEAQSLSDAFMGAAIWFNHFVKVESTKVLDQAYLTALLCRGAAVVCKPNQRGVDLVIPVLFHDSLQPCNVSAILVQVKNDQSFTDKVKQYLFDSLNPFDAGVFAPGTEKTLPVIRMVFALAAPTETVILYRPWSQRSSTRLSAKRFAKIQAYDIWCAGATAKTFKVIEEEELLARLLRRYRQTPNAYGSDDVDLKLRERRSSARRKMHPGVSEEKEHYARYLCRVPKRKADEAGG